MASSPDMFESAPKRSRYDEDEYTVDIGQTLVFFNGRVLKVGYMGVPVIIPGTGICHIVRNIAAEPAAYIFTQIDKSNRFIVTKNGHNVTRLVFTPI